VRADAASREASPPSGRALEAAAWFFKAVRLKRCSNKLAVTNVQFSEMILPTLARK
jgi:hypothetical protein